MEIDKTRLKDNLKLLAICIPVVAVLLFLDNRYAARTNLSSDLKSTDIEVEGLVINEIMTSNKGVFVDDNGKLYDWIELYNGTNSDINLKNYGLSDSLDEKIKWLFPDITIKSKGYLIIYLTEMETDGLYAPFSLKRTGGENVTLRSSSGDIIDTVKTINMPKNKSMARDGDGNWSITDTITPGFSNNNEGREDYLKSLEQEEKQIIITELLPNNKGNFSSEGNLIEYIELNNISDETVNLRNYYISNDLNKPFLFRLEDIDLKPGEVYLLYTDGLNKDDHTSFELDSKNGGVYLSKKNKVIDKIEYENLDNGIAIIYEDDSYIRSSEISPGFVNTSEGKKSFESFIKKPNELIINEVMNSNNKYLAQNGGKYYDWIELYNNTNKTINLNEYSLTKEKDDYNNKLPDIKLKKNEYIVIMASGDSRLKNLKYYHLDFKLSNRDGLFLYHNNTLVDSMFINNIPKNYSYGKGRETGNYYFKKPTPKGENEKSGALEISYAPVFSKEAGCYNDLKYLDIELNSNGKIYYTLDGSKPTKNSLSYNGAIRIKENTTIRAIAYKEGAIESEIVTNTYIINQKHTLPVLSITMNENDFKKLNNSPGSNITVNSHVQLLDKDNNFNIDCGMKVFGGDSRYLPKKSYALKFKKEYGGVLKSKVFDTRDAYEYETLVLRSGSQDMDGSMFKDELVSSVLDKYGTVDVQANRPIILYINNKYWGIYYIREKIDGEFIKNHYSINSGTTNIVRIDYDVTDGSSKMLKELNDYVTSHDMSKDSNYKEIEKKLDIDNFIDLWIAQLYSGDYDTRNVRFFNNQNIDNGKIKMIGYDFDFAFEHYPDNYFVWMFDSSGMGYYKINNKLILNLIKNKKFKNKFLERLGYNLNNVWTYEHMMEFYNKYYDLIKSEIKRDHDRWNFSYESWKSKCKQIKTFIKKRNELIKNQAKSYFGLSDKEVKKYFSKN